MRQRKTANTPRIWAFFCVVCLAGWFAAGSLNGEGDGRYQIFVRFAGVLGDCRDAGHIDWSYAESVHFRIGENEPAPFPPHPEEPGVREHQPGHGEEPEDPDDPRRRLQPPQHGPNAGQHQAEERERRDPAAPPPPAEPMRAFGHDAIITKFLDRATPALARHAAEHRRFSSVTIDFASRDEKQSVFLRVELEDVGLNFLSFNGESHSGAPAPLEEIALNYQRLTFTYWPKDAKGGNLSAPIKATINH